MPIGNAGIGSAGLSPITGIGGAGISKIWTVPVIVTPGVPTIVGTEITFPATSDGTLVGAVYGVEFGVGVGAGYVWSENVAGAAVSQTITIDIATYGGTTSSTVNARIYYNLDVLDDPSTRVYSAMLAPIVVSASETGTTTEGETLTGANGIIVGGYQMTLSQSWSACNTAGTSCTPITAGTATTYVLTASEVGDTIKYTKTATNSAGSGSATSAASAVVASSVVPLVLDTNAKGAQAQPTIASPYQYTFTPNNPPTKVFVGVGYFDTTGSITGVTYGGQAMTAQGAAINTGTNIYLRVYELLNPTDTNAALIEVTVSEDFTGMGISVVSFTGGDTAATIRGSITTATGDSTSMTVTQSSATDDIILAFGINAVDSNTLTYSAGTKVGTDAAVYTQFLRTVGQRAGAASAAVTASCSLSRWLMWSMSVKS